MAQTSTARIARAVTSSLLGAAMMLGCAAPWAHAGPLGPIPAAQIDVGGMLRTYQLHLPPGMDKPSGLVVNLHAAGLTGADQAALTHYDSVADAHGFAVVYPDGIDRSWADGRGASVPDREGVDDVGFITTLVDRLVTDFGIPRDRCMRRACRPGPSWRTGWRASAPICSRRSHRSREPSVRMWDAARHNPFPCWRCTAPPIRSCRSAGE